MTRAFLPLEASKNCSRLFESFPLVIGPVPGPPLAVVGER